ncbi:hypothetical protein KKD42_01930, partial [Patescibacteria group bacterium]|nr:hypothetical protein [Patescibacteria group bacterium]
LKGSRNIVSEARKVLAHLKRKGERYSGAERIALEDEVRVSLTTHFAAEGMSLTEAQRQTANIVSSAMSERPRQFRRSDPPRDHAVTIIPKESEAPPAMEEKMAADAGETPKAERTPEQIAAHHAEIAAKLAAKEQRRMAQEALDAAKRGSKERRAEAMEATREKRAAEKAKAEAATAAKRAKSEAKRAKSEKRAGRGGAQASA